MGDLVDMARARMGMLGLAVKLDMVGSGTERYGFWIGFCASLVSKLATPFGKYIQGSLDFYRVHLETKYRSR